MCSFKSIDDYNNYIKSDKIELNDYFENVYKLFYNDIVDNDFIKFSLTYIIDNKQFIIEETKLKQYKIIKSFDEIENLIEKYNLVENEEYLVEISERQLRTCIKQYYKYQFTTDTFKLILMKHNKKYFTYILLIDFINTKYNEYRNLYNENIFINNKNNIELISKNIENFNKTNEYIMTHQIIIIIVLICISYIINTQF